jgi:glyoxylase-like metal-dependent hydrolase (beta-lactamase superfamily II)
MNIKFSIPTLLLILFAGIIVSAQEVFKNNDLSISRLEKNMWVVETSDSTTMYIIEGTQKAMLIDTGTKCEKLDEVIQKITQKPLVVVLTHAHGDHSGNIRFFKEIYLHPADTVLLDKSYKGKVNFVKDGEVFDLGGTKIEAVHAPGHTLGSIVLLDWASGNCYSGDAFGSGQIWLQLRPSSPIKTYIKSCKKMGALMDKGISKIYCGHYPYVKKAYDKTYIKEMRQLAEGLDKGTAPEGKPFPIKELIGGNNPMVTSLGSVSIVYDPAFLK